jgi:hypothetical protein
MKKEGEDRPRRKKKKKMDPEKKTHTNESMQSEIQKKNKWFSTWNGWIVLPNLE